MREERRARKNCGMGSRRVGQGEGRNGYFLVVNYGEFSELNRIWGWN